MTVDISHLEFSDAAKERIEWLRTRYPADHQRALILPVLSMAQREFGWVGPDIVHFVAAQIPVPPMWVEEVATFYTMYNTQPTGRWHLQVCHNLSCCLMGAEVVIEHIEKKLGVKKGETTPDREFTLVGAECLGSCGTAPMMQVNDHYYENLSLAAVDELIDRLRSTEDTAPVAADLAHGPGSGPGRRLPSGIKRLEAGRGVVLPGHAHDDKPSDRPRAEDPADGPSYGPRDMAQ